MSIFQGLVQSSMTYSDMGNALNVVNDNTDTTHRLSTLYNKSGKILSFNKPRFEGARWGMRNIKRSLVGKTFVYSLYVHDGETGQLISPQSLNYEFLFSSHLTSGDVYKTATSFNIKYDHLSRNKLTNLTVRIRGENYLTTYAQIGSDVASSLYEQHIGIVNVNNVPDGVSVVMQDLEQDENGTVQEYTLYFAQSDTRLEWSEIIIPQGTKFYDKNKQRLTGDLSVKAGHFSPTNGTSLSLFAPGWNVPNLRLDGELIGDGYNFVSWGFYSIEIVNQDDVVAKSINP